MHKEAQGWQSIPNQYFVIKQKQMHLVPSEMTAEDECPTEAERRQSAIDKLIEDAQKHVQG